MKEAAGEANMTVITIVLIGIVAAIAIPLVTNLMGNTQRKSCCTSAGGEWTGNTCAAGGNAYYDEATYNACIAED